MQEGTFPGELGIRLAPYSVAPEESQRVKLLTEAIGSIDALSRNPGTEDEPKAELVFSWDYDEKSQQLSDDLYKLSGVDEADLGSSSWDRTISEGITIKSRLIPTAFDNVFIHEIRKKGVGLQGTNQPEGTHKLSIVSPCPRDRMWLDRDRSA